MATVLEGFALYAEAMYQACFDVSAYPDRRRPVKDTQLSGPENPARSPARQAA
jgi:hypothetical protein